MANESKEPFSPSRDDINEGNSGVPPKDPPSMGDGGNGRDKKTSKHDQKEQIISGFHPLRHFREDFAAACLLTEWMEELLRELREELVELLVQVT